MSREMLAGQTVIVTGAASGVGAATARRVAAEGATAVLVDLDADQLDVVAASIDDIGGRSFVVFADIAQDRSCRSVVDAAISQTGRIDGLVNNAGIPGSFGSLADGTEDGFDRMVDVNLKGAWLLFRAARDALVASRGSVVNTLSYASGRANTDLGFYGMTKAGLRSLTQTAAIELARTGVRVNAVAPGPIDTPMIRKLESRLSPDDERAGRHKISRGVPMGRYGQPEEIAAAIVFLLGPDASFITGTVLAVDGGMAAA